MNPGYDRELARLKNFDFALSDHGFPVLKGTFDYGGSGQGFGYVVDTDFITAFLRAVGVNELQQVNGKTVWVTHSNFQIFKIEPLMKGDGETFDVTEWVKAKQAL